MTPNQKPSEAVAILATLDPASVAASTVTTGWVDAKNFFALLLLLQTGVLGAAATVDAKLQQAKDSGGTGVKDITGKTITQIVKATGDNKQAEINVKVADLDTEGGFEFVRASVTVGVAASQLSAALVGFFPRFADAGAAFNQAAVAQIV